MRQNALKSFLVYGPQFAVEAEAQRRMDATSGADHHAKRPFDSIAMSCDPTIATRTEAERVIGQIEDTVASLRAELAPYLPPRATADR